MIEELSLHVIKNDVNTVFNHYYEAIVNIIKKINWELKHFNEDDLISFSYEKIWDICENYKPYIDGKFYHFSGYLLRSIKQYIITYVLKTKEKETLELTKDIPSKEVDDNYKYQDDKIFNIIKLFPQNYQIMINMVIKGYKEKEIGDKLNLTPVRINQMKKALKKVYNKPAKENSLQWAIEELQKHLNIYVEYDDIQIKQNILTVKTTNQYYITKKTLITKQLIEEIRLANRICSKRELSKIYDLSYSTISNMIKNKAPYNI